jgi:hypothetical protein
MALRSGSETRKRTVLLTARFNQQEAASIRQIADRSGLSIASLMRRALLDTPPPRATRRPPADVQAVARLLGQLGKIGSNINQLAKHANAGRYQENSIELALRDLGELRIVCLQALGKEPHRGAAQDD